MDRLCKIIVSKRKVCAILSVLSFHIMYVTSRPGPGLIFMATAKSACMCCGPVGCSSRLHMYFNTDAWTTNLHVAYLETHTHTQLSLNVETPLPSGITYFGQRTEDNQTEKKTTMTMTNVASPPSLSLLCL